MWKVSICIDSDGDFGFEETILNDKEGLPREFYFEKRKDAVRAILESFHSLKNTLRPCGRDHIKDWIDAFDSHIELIVRKMPTFIIYKCFGNQEITYELLECSKIEIPEFNTFRYEVTFIPSFDFSDYEPNELRWDVLESDYPDVEVSNTRKVDRSKKSNIKCEHCKFWDKETMKCLRYSIPKKYWNRCKDFEWRED